MGYWWLFFVLFPKRNTTAFILVPREGADPIRRRGWLTVLGRVWLRRANSRAARNYRFGGRTISAHRYPAADMTEDLSHAELTSGENG